MKSLHFPHPEKSRAKLVEVSSLRLDLIVHKIDWRRVAGLFGGSMEGLLANIQTMHIYRLTGE